MNQDVQLLNYVYQNSQMGIITLGKLVEIVPCGDFKNQLNSQLDEYMLIHKTAKEMLHKHGCDEKGINVFEKIKTYLMLNLQTLTDKSVSHIAEMLIIGSNMGVIDAIKNIKKYSGAQPETIGLMRNLKAYEENNITALKNYL